MCFGVVSAVGRRGIGGKLTGTTPQDIANPPTLNPTSPFNVFDIEGERRRQRENLLRNTRK